MRSNRGVLKGTPHTVEMFANAVSVLDTGEWRFPADISGRYKWFSDVDGRGSLVRLNKSRPTPTIQKAKTTILYHGIDLVAVNVFASVRTYFTTEQNEFKIIIDRAK